MKKLLLVAALLAANCLAEESAQPSFSSIHNLCHAEGHKMATFGRCLRAKLDRYYPNWQTLDADSKPVMWYLDYVETLGASVRKKEISEARANDLAKQELANLTAEKHRKLQAAIAEHNAKEEALRRKLAEDQEALRRWRAEEQASQAEQQRYEQALAIQRLQEQQLQQQRNQQMFDAGIQLMQLNKRQAAPVIIPQQTTINIEQQRSSTPFSDASPYRR